MKKMLFVMNPNAGTRKANKVLTEILSVFSGAGYEICVHITRGPADARQAVCRLAPQMDLVVCCGGDGTFNETTAGLMESGADVPLGYIPAGSTNDFASSLGLFTDPEEAARRIVKGTQQRYDLGSFGGRYFTYVASFGAFTKTSYATPQNIKNALGSLAYFLEGVSELSQLRPVNVRLELENEVVEDAFLFGAICNSTSIGKVLKLDARQVDMSDGKFEIFLVRAPKDLSEIAECLQALQKQVYNCKMITFRSASRVRVTTEEEIPWSLDGEREDGRREVLVENLQQAFCLVR